MPTDITREETQAITSSLVDLSDVVNNLITRINGLSTSQNAAAKGLNVYREGVLKSANSFKSLSSAINDAKRDFENSTKSGIEYGKQLQSVKEKTATLADQLYRRVKVSGDLTKSLAQEILSLKQVEIQTQKVWEKIDKLEKSARPFGERFKEGSKRLLDFGSSTKMALASTIGLSIGMDHLKTTLLSYNRTMYDSMRIGQRYGDSLSSFENAYIKLSAATSYSKKDFADLNKTFKELYLGIPPSSQAIAGLAETMSGRLGYSVDEINKGFQNLINIQQKLPDIFERVQRAQEAYSRSTKEGNDAAASLHYTLMQMGMGRQEIEGVMNAIAPKDKTLDGLMEFEKTISNTRKQVENAQLKISQDMSPAMETMAKLSGNAATLVGSLSYAVVGLAVALGSLSIAMGTFGAYLKGKELIEILTLFRGAGGGVKGLTAALAATKSIGAGKNVLDATTKTTSGKNIIDTVSQTTKNILPKCTPICENSIEKIGEVGKKSFKSGADAFGKSVKGGMQQSTMSSMTQTSSSISKGMGWATKGLGGFGSAGVGVVGGALSGYLKYKETGSVSESAFKGVGTTIATTIGTALAGPVGGIIGGAINEGIDRGMGLLGKITEEGWGNVAEKVLTKIVTFGGVKTSPVFSKATQSDVSQTEAHEQVGEMLTNLYVNINKAMYEARAKKEPGTAGTEWSQEKTDRARKAGEKLAAKDVLRTKEGDLGGLLTDRQKETARDLVRYNKEHLTSDQKIVAIQSMLLSGSIKKKDIEGELRTLYLGSVSHIDKSKASQLQLNIAVRSEKQLREKMNEIFSTQFILRLREKEINSAILEDSRKQLQQIELYKGILSDIQSTYPAFLKEMSQEGIQMDPEDISRKMDTVIAVTKEKLKQQTDAYTINIKNALVSTGKLSEQAYNVNPDEVDKLTQAFENTNSELEKAKKEMEDFKKIEKSLALTPENTLTEDKLKAKEGYGTKLKNLKDKERAAEEANKNITRAMKDVGLDVLKAQQKELEEILKTGNKNKDVQDKYIATIQAINAMTKAQVDMQKEQLSLVKSRIAASTEPFAAELEQHKQNTEYLKTERDLISVIGMGYTHSYKATIDLNDSLVKQQDVLKKMRDSLRESGTGIVKFDEMLAGTLDPATIDKFSSELQDMGKNIDFGDILGASGISQQEKMQQAAEAITDQIAKRAEIQKGSAKYDEIKYKTLMQINAVVKKDRDVAIESKKIEIERMNIAKEMRDGWLDATKEMIINGGAFSEIIATQKLGITQTMELGGAQGAMRLGAIGKAGQSSKTPARYTTNQAGGVGFEGGGPDYTKQRSQEFTNNILQQQRGQGINTASVGASMAAKEGVGEWTLATAREKAEQGQGSFTLSGTGTTNISGKKNNGGMAGNGCVISKNRLKDPSLQEYIYQLNPKIIRGETGVDKIRMPFGNVSDGEGLVDGHPDRVKLAYLINSKNLPELEKIFGDSTPGYAEGGIFGDNSQTLRKTSFGMNASVRSAGIGKHGGVPRSFGGGVPRSFGGTSQTLRKTSFGRDTSVHSSGIGKHGSGGFGSQRRRNFAEGGIFEGQGIAIPKQQAPEIPSSITIDVRLSPEVKDLLQVDTKTTYPTRP